MDDEPAWKNRPEDSHSGRILALSHCIFDFHVRTECHAIEGPIETFDNKCASDLEMPARILAKAGITRFIDDIGRRSIFLCPPSDFERIAYSEDMKRIDVEDVCEAVFWLAEGHFKSSEEIDLLAYWIKLR